MRTNEQKNQDTANNIKNEIIKHANEYLNDLSNDDFHGHPNPRLQFDDECKTREISRTKEIIEIVENETDYRWFLYHAQDFKGLLNEISLNGKIIRMSEMVDGINEMEEMLK